MAGTKEGGIKTAATNIRKYGEDHYRKIGALGGMVRVPKGFAINRELARTAGAKGGKASKRGKLWK